jgi:Fuc2NAc and GlcNAc transferase
MLANLVVTIIAGLASFAAAWLVRRNATRLGLIQTPNARSSHSVPTPGGGGVGIVLGGSIATAIAAVGSGPTLAVLVAGMLIAAIGFYDDRKPLPARFRLIAQLILVAATLWLAVPLEPLTERVGLPLPSFAILAVAVIAIVYWINLFNFMDGIDGIAGSQAIFMALAAALLTAMSMAAHGHGFGGPLFWILLELAAATAGFLVLNWPPARIFMGDAGSTYLGFMLAVLALLTVAYGVLTLPQWAILAASFVTDATVTLLRRLLRGERVSEAHRRHAYQVLSRRWGGHLRVTLSFIGVNVIWLLPLAWLAGQPGWTIGALLLAYLPLIGIALAAGAGAPERPITPK